MYFTLPHQLPNNMTFTTESAPLEPKCLQRKFYCRYRSTVSGNHVSMKLLRRLNFSESENRTENSRGNSKAGKTDNAFYDFRLNINYFGKTFRVGTRDAFINTKK
jgi:hypothetical protein